jgi:GTPase
MVETFRSGFVAIVGRPNVGKSTLINTLVGEKVAITTPKPQTTRDRIRGIVTSEEAQVILVDTPGIHQARNKLNRYMVDVAVATLGDVDLVYLLVDVPHLVSKPEKVLEETRAIIDTIRGSGTKTFLIPNKVDLVPDKASLLPLIESLNEMHDFAEIVPISAKKGDGTQRLLDMTKTLLPEGPALFPGDSLTDRNMRFMAREIVREKLFMRLKKELPYQIAVSIDSWKEKEDGLLVIHSSIHVARASQKAIVIGRGAGKLKAVGQHARKDLERLTGCRVFLDLHVRVEDDWIDKEAGLRKLGYDET